MHDVAHRLIGTAEAASHRGSRPGLGMGEEDLAAAYSKGGRRPVSSVARSSAVTGRTHKGVGILYSSTVVICHAGTPMIPLGQTDYPDQDKGVCDGTADS